MVLRSSGRCITGCLAPCAVTGGLGGGGSSPLHARAGAGGPRGWLHYGLNFESFLLSPRDLLPPLQGQSRSEASRLRDLESARILESVEKQMAGWGRRLWQLSGRGWEWGQWWSVGSEVSSAGPWGHQAGDDLCPLWDSLEGS